MRRPSPQKEDLHSSPSRSRVAMNDLPQGRPPTKPRHLKRLPKAPRDAPLILADKPLRPATKSQGTPGSPPTPRHTGGGSPPGPCTAPRGPAPHTDASVNVTGPRSPQSRPRRQGFPTHRNPSPSGPANAGTQTPSSARDGLMPLQGQRRHQPELRHLRPYTAPRCPAPFTDLSVHVAGPPSPQSRPRR